MTVVPHTTSVREPDSKSRRQVRFLKAGAFDIQGILSIPLAKLMRSLGVLPPEPVATVETILIQWLGLPISQMEAS